MEEVIFSAEVRQIDDFDVWTVFIGNECVTVQRVLQRDIFAQSTNLELKMASHF